MKQVKIIAAMLLLSFGTFAQTVTPNPGPYTPMAQKYQYPWIKTTGGVWNTGKFVQIDSAQFSGITYVPDAPVDDSSTQAANTRWIRQNISPGTPGTPTSVWQFLGNYSPTDPTLGRIGFIDSFPLSIITDNEIRITIPDNGIKRSAGLANKVLMIDTITKNVYYADAGGGGSGDTTGIGDLYIRNIATQENKRFNVKGGRLDSLYASTSGGGKVVSNGGTVAAEWGAGGGSNFDFHGFAGYNLNRASSYTARSFTDKNYVDSSLTFVNSYIDSTTLSDSLAYYLPKSDTTNKWVQSVANNAGGDSLIVIKNGVRTANKYPSGGGGIIGSGVANQVSYWDGTSSQKGNSQFYYDSSLVVVNGKQSVTIGQFNAFAASGSNTAIAIELNNTSISGKRWSFRSVDDGKFSFGSPLLSGIYRSNFSGDTTGKVSFYGTINNAGSGIISWQLSQISSVDVLHLGQPSPTINNYAVGQYLGELFLNATTGNNVNLRVNNATKALVYGSSGNFGIGTSSDVASAILQVNSTTKGVLLPRLTTTQRDAIASPATGLSVYNTTTNTNDTYLGGAWVNDLQSASPSFTGLLSGVGTTQTGSSAVGVVDLSQTWNTTGNVTGIKYNAIITASGGSSNLMDLQVGGVSQFKVSKVGNISTVSPAWVGIENNSGGVYISPTTILQGFTAAQLAVKNASVAEVQLSVIGGVAKPETRIRNQLSVGNFSTVTNASAIVEVASTTQGFLPPRMTTTQKNAIASPATGLMVFDTTLAKLCVYTGAAWETITSL